MKRLCSLLLIQIAILVSFSACKKNDSSDKRTIVGGIVVTYPSRQPLSGQRVYLVRQGVTVIQYEMNIYWHFFYLDTLIWPPKFRVDSTITDVNGRFSFKYNPSDCQGYPCGGVFYPTVLDPGYIVIAPPSTLNNDTIFVDHPSYFKVNMHKSVPATLNDTVFENRAFINDLNATFFRFPVYLRKAQIGQTNTTITDTFSFNVYNKVILEWRYYKNGLMQSSIDTITLIPNSTKEFNVIY
jgi:hypothetical protein